MKSACSRPRCTCCGTSETPLWRSGPQGAKSLCNACGVRFKKGKLRYNPEFNRFILLDQGLEETWKPSFSSCSPDSCCFFSEESRKSDSGGNVRRSGEINPVRKRNKSIKLGKSLQRTKSCHQLETNYNQLSQDVGTKCQQTNDISIPETTKESVDDKTSEKISETSRNWKQEKRELCPSNATNMISSQKEKAFSAPSSPVSNFYLCEKMNRNELQKSDERWTFITSPKPRYFYGGVSPALFQYVKLLDCLTLGTHSRKRSLDNCEISSIFDRCVSYSAPYVSPQSPSTPETCVRELDALNIRYDSKNEESLESGMYEDQLIDKETKEQSYSEEDFIAELNAAILKCNGMYHTDLEEDLKLEQNSNPHESGPHSQVQFETKLHVDSSRACMDSNEDSCTHLQNQLQLDTEYKSNLQQLYSLMKREFSFIVPPRGLFSVYCKNAVERVLLDNKLEKSYSPYLETCVTLIKKNGSILGLDKVSITDILVRDICQGEELKLESSESVPLKQETSSINTNTKTDRLNTKVVKSVKPTPA